MTTLLGYLCGPEPAEITWTLEGVDVVAATEREWWHERLGYRARQYGEAK